MILINITNGQGEDLHVLQNLKAENLEGGNINKPEDKVETPHISSSKLKEDIDKCSQNQLNSSAMNTHVTKVELIKNQKYVLKTILY
mmetsp:Transcript_20346/g.28595  ORF Transcript_20346/g.28595 Transcript_20346/m.28595 type:complete len:87 (+) Transcript_20346:460-720(+)